MAGCPQLEQIEAFVAGRDGSDEVRAHVSSCVDCRRRTDEIRELNRLFDELASAHDSAAGPSPDSRESAPPPELPTIDGYRVVELLHRGGQGVVFAAVQLSTQRKVALKVLLEGALATPAQLRRFEREIETVLRLRHPNVVTVFDRGVTRDGRHFFAMEFVDGVALDRFAAQRRAAGWSTRETLALFGKVCDAVAYAHQRGVIHRDLKPGNVLVDSAGEPRVLDFGLAKAIADDAGAAPVTVTRPGWFVGTLAYASPEQLRGDSDQVDVRSDVYSLGVLLFELLVGRAPYPVDGAMPDVVRAIVETEPQFPRGRDALDDDLAAILRRALAKEREHRYQSTSELRRDLDHFLRGEPVDARRGRLGYVLRKTIRRHKVRFAVAASVLLVLVGSAIFSTISWQRAVREGEQARIDATTRARIDAFVLDMLDALDPDRTKGRTVTMREVVDEAARRLDHELKEEPAIEAGMRSTLGVTYRGLGLYAESEHHLQRALEIQRSLHPGGSVEVVDLLWNLAHTATDRADFARAKSLATEGMELLERVAPNADAERADLLTELAFVHDAQGEFDQAAPLQRRAIELLQTLGDERSIANALTNIGETLVARSHFAEAESDLRQALAIRKRLGDFDRLDSEATLIRLGELLEATDHFDEARGCFEEAARIEERLRGRKDGYLLTKLALIADESEGSEAAADRRRQAQAARPKLEGAESADTAGQLCYLALLEENAGELATAESDLRSSLAIYDRLLGRKSSSSAAVLDNLSWLLYLRGQYVEAERAGRESLALKQELHDGDDLRFAHSQVNLAWIVLERGLATEAEQLARESLATLERLVGPDHSQSCRARNVLTWLLHARGDDADAEKLGRENLERATQQFGETNAQVALNGRTLAEVLRALGDKDAEAEELYRRAIDVQRQLLGGSSLDLAMTLDNYGWFLIERRRVKEAGPILQEGLAIRRRQLGAGHPLLCWSTNNVGVFDYFSGDLAGAEKLFRETVAAARETVGKDDPGLGVWIGNLGALELARDRGAAAEPLLLESYEIAKTARGAAHPKTLQALANVVAVEKKLGHADLAAKYSQLLDAANSATSKPVPPTH